MKTIYTATKDVKVTLKITNQKYAQSVVFLKNVEYDDVELSEGKDNTRVLEIELKQGDVISINENKLIEYTLVY